MPLVKMDMWWFLNKHILLPLSGISHFWSISPAIWFFFIFTLSIISFCAVPSAFPLCVGHVSSCICGFPNLHSLHHHLTVRHCRLVPVLPSICFRHGSALFGFCDSSNSMEQGPLREADSHSARQEIPQLFMNLWCALSYSQEPNTGPCPMPVQSNRRHISS
jgi:hypothetical protein